MKQIKILFLVIITLISCSEESSNPIIENCESFNYSKLEKSLDEYKTNSNEKNKNNWNVVLEREIVDGFIEKIINYWNETQDENNEYIYHSTSYRIKIIEKNNKICFYEISKTNGIFSEKVTENIIRKSTTKKLNVLNEIYKKVYKSEMDFKGLFQTNIVYGSHCGSAGVNPIYKTKLDKLIKERDIVTLIKWLKSSTTEIQLYAIEGIFELKDQMNIDKEIFDLITIIENKKGNAYVCLGCIHRYEKITKIVSQIKK